MQSGSNWGDGRANVISDQSVLLVGGEYKYGARLVIDRKIKSGSTPTSTDLYITCLQTTGVNVDRFTTPRRNMNGSFPD